MSRPAHDLDLAGWATATACALREGRLADVDLEQVAEELDTMGRSARRELVSRLTVVLAHLLKWQFQSERRSRSWAVTLLRERQELAALLEESPSLRGVLPDALARAYVQAVRLAASETELPVTTFPTACPITAAQALDVDYLPG